MSDQPLHREFLHFSELPYSMRVLYTAALLILGMGYLFAGLYLFHVYAGKDGNAMSLSYDDLVIAYTGSGKGSRLESALRGAMSTMLPPEELTRVVEWVQQGADQPGYEKRIRPTIDRRCVSCHDGSNPHLPNLVGYDNMKKVTERDTGTDVFTLVRVSHIHFFGLTFIFFIVGTIFGHAYIRPVWLKCSLIALPFVVIAIDISSWYLVKLFHPFAWVTMGAGMLMAVAFTIMWSISMYQLWFSAPPKAVASREGTHIRSVG